MGQKLIFLKKLCMFACMCIKYNSLKFNLKLKHPQAGIALKGQCDLVSIMVPPKVSIKEKFS